MDLSVIIPVYNVESTLKRCIDSVIVQGIDSCEIILVDDGSTDRSGMIADGYAGTYSYIRCYHKPNGGLSDARNVGILHASGKYITFVDSDDALLPNTYGKLLDILALHPEYDILEYSVLQNPNCRDETLFSPGENVFYDAMEWLSYKGFEHCWAWNKIYRRTLFEGIQYTLHRKYEDILMLPALFKKKPVFATTSWGTYLYFRNDVGIAAKDKQTGLTELLRAEMEVVKALGIDTHQKRFHRLYVNMFTAQLYFFCKTGKIQLWEQRVKLQKYGTTNDTIKAICLYCLGLQGACRIFKWLSSLKR